MYYIKLNPWIGYISTPEVVRPREQNIQLESRDSTDRCVPSESKTHAVTSRLPQTSIPIIECMLGKLSHFPILFDYNWEITPPVWSNGDPTDNG